MLSHALWCEVFRLAGSMVAIRRREDVPCFLGGAPGVRILMCSTSEHKLHSRTSFVSVASAANLTVFTHFCCTEWLFRCLCCRRMKGRAYSRREESVFYLSFDYFRTQICVMFLLEHSRILCFPPSTGELRPPVVPPRHRCLILSILPSLPFALLASIS